VAKFKEIREIPLEDLEIGLGQVRLRDVSKDIDELAASIKKVGLLEPIVVCESEEDGKFEIITGQRRFLAHQELGLPTILAAILTEKVDETQAKILSVTENLVRRDLASRDLIDVCTELFHKYGSIRDVADETGLPYRKVSQYVKYDQLIPQLRALVDAGETTLPVALRAQRAASVTGDTNADEAVALAKEMAPMSGAQQKKIVDEREANPDTSVDDVIEQAKSGGKITQIVVTLTSSVHGSLTKYAAAEETGLDDAARQLIEDALSDRGYLEDGQ